MIPTGLFAYYEQASKPFIEDLGKPVLLYFHDGYESGQPLIEGGEVTDMFGGTNFLSNVHGKPQVEQDNLKEKYRTESIKARVYWLSANDAMRSINYRGESKICKINTYISDIPKLNNCVFAEVNSELGGLIKAKILNNIPPIPYGLGPRPQYAITYWEA